MTSAAMSYPHLQKLVNGAHARARMNPDNKRYHYSTDPQYKGSMYNYTGRYAERETLRMQVALVVSTPQVSLETVLARATKKGMTVVQYCELIGMPI